MTQPWIEKDPPPLLANLAQYLQPCRHLIWYLSHQQHLVHRSWGCFLQGIRAHLCLQLYPKGVEGSYYPVLTCSWLSPHKSEDFGEQMRASTSMVSPRACISGLKEYASDQYDFQVLTSPGSGSFPSLLPQTW